jgi:hypothetical protein
MLLFGRSRFYVATISTTMTSFRVTIIIPNGIQLFFSGLLGAHKQVAIFRLASLQLQELIELKHSPLATSVSLRSFVEERSSRVVNTGLSFSVAIVRCLTTFPSTCLSLLNWSIWIVIF